MATNMSDSDLSSEWAFIPAADKSLEIKVEEKGDETRNILSTDSSTDVTENSGIHKGSCVQDDPLLEPVSHIEDKDFSVQAESTSSSDIDIIDEILEEHPMSISLPSSDLAISSSAALNANSLPAISEGEDAVTEIPKDFQAMKNLASERVEQWVESMTNSCNAMKERFPPWLLRMPDTFDDMVTTFMPSHFFLVLLMLVCGIILSQYCFSLDMSETATIAQIKEIVKELKFESRDLKNQMITEIQNEKVFATLEGQIKELKKENFKLSEMLQDVILELQKQTAIPVKKNEVRETESHGIFESEINKLKEQINILQFDNEELQKQLVRIRYGDKSQVDNYAKNDDSKKKETVSNDAENLADDEINSSNVLSEDVVELQKDLHSEVLKLKKWNELFELLTKELDKAAGSKAFKKSKSEEPKSSKKSDEKKKLFGNWSWKSFQKNLKGTIDNFQKINVSELAAKFVSYKNKQVDGVFTSVGNYFKMAREETRKFFDTHSYNKEKVKNDVPNNKRDIDIWLAELRKKFDEMKLFFMPTHSY